MIHKLTNYTHDIHENSNSKLKILKVNLDMGSSMYYVCVCVLGVKKC